MILRDRCSTSYDLASIFRGRRSTLDRWSGKTARRIGTRWYEAVSAALNFPFLEEVSQNCFVFDVVKFKTWGRLAELLRFWCCQLWKMKKSRRIASFLTLSSSNIENVSQDCCVFDVVNEKMRASRRIASFLTLSSSKIEGVSQNCCVFDVVKFKTWGCLAE